MVSLALVAATSFAANEPPKKSEGSPLHCHLIAVKESDAVDGSFPGVLEVRNDTKEPIAIRYLDSVTEHLALDILDPAGKPVPNAIRRYGSLYATVRMLNEIHYKTLVLKPGEKYRANLVLFGQVDRESHPLIPGKHTIKAVFEWGGKEFQSNRVTVEVLAK
jgi:hypothetical protein